jgi:DedD protein
MSNTQDTEITLGTGKMLILFFGLVALCAVFFGMGYSLGRTSEKPGAREARTEQPSGTPSVAQPATDEDRAKPTDFSLLRASERKDASTPPGEVKTADASTAAPAAEAATNKQPAAPDPTAIAYNNPYFVQVAAVSKQEDAEALVDALKKKQYPAFTANGSTTDKLYHVQVGPYGDLKDAEATRGKLVSDGYSPILKK